MKLFFVALLLALTLNVGAQSTQSVTVTTSKVTAKSGEVIDATVKITNTDVLQPTFKITVTATYTDVYGVEQTSYGESLPIQVVRPIVSKDIKLPISTSLLFVDNSATIAGVVIPATMTGEVLTLPVNKTLNEQESVEIKFSLKGK